MSVELAEVPARYAQPDPSTLAKLPKPTKSDNPKGKCDVCGGYHGLPAVHLDYMGHADVTLALIDVDPAWTWEPVAIDPESGGPTISNQGGKRLVLWGWLIVGGVRRLCVGTCDAGKGDPEKELIGDLLRNGAMRFGIGTKLWSKADSADPAGSGKAGGYDRKPKGQNDAPHPNSERVAETFTALKRLDVTAQAAFKAWANGRSTNPTALLGDEQWLGLVEDWICEYEQTSNLAGVK